MSDGRHFHRHNLNITQVEQTFIDAIKEDSEYIKAQIGIDLGAGGGRFSRILSEYVERLYSVDVSDEAIAAMHRNLAGLENVKIIKAPRNALPFKDSSIDIVFAANSFHDVPEGYEKEISRVLNKDGRFIDLDWKKKETAFGPPVSIRFSENDVIGKLEKQGLILIKKQDLGTHYMLVFSKVKI